MKLCLPGDFLAIEEEFSPGQNVFEEEGNLLADSAGQLQEDKQHKTVSIAKPKNIAQLKTGSIVFGIVGLVKNSSVLIELSALRSKSERQAIGSSFAQLPVKNVSHSYIKNLKEKFKIGDIVKARIAIVKPWGIDLTTNAPDLGVVKAFCTKCRQPLHVFGNAMKCTNCGNSEERKTSSDYGAAFSFEENAGCQKNRLSL